MWSVFVSIPPSRQSPLMHFTYARSWPRWSCVKASLKLGNNHSITKMNIPNSLRRICNHAFYYSLRTLICLHDGIESIGTNAFASCIFTNFRVPSLITEIPNYMLFNCRTTFSLELSEHISEIGSRAFTHCYCLRNVAFPPITRSTNILDCQICCIVAIPTIVKPAEGKMESRV